MPTGTNRIPKEQRMTDQRVSTACVVVDGECTNASHDHLGGRESWENGSEEPWPHGDDDHLRCGDCDALTFYDYGDDFYHHTDPNAPGCFLIPADESIEEADYHSKNPGF